MKMSSTEGITLGYSGQCFPVRSLTKFKATDDEGAWLFAYKAEQRRRFKAVLCQDPSTSFIPKVKKRAQSAGEQSVSTDAPNKLDGFFIMNTFHIDDPADICSLNISGKELEEVEEEDFVHFNNIVHVDAGENRLPFVAFSKFSSLRELEMPLNGLSGEISMDENDFQLLEILDLSCNELVDQDILYLGALPRLRVLHLSGNGIQKLPQEMARTSQKYTDSDGKIFEVKRLQFSCLEKLHLDQNELTELSTFSSLAGLPRLRYLNLEGNQISSVPHLRLMGAQIRPPSFQNIVYEENDVELENIDESKPHAETDYHADDEEDEDEIDDILNKSRQNLKDDVSLPKVGLKRRATSNLTESNFALQDLRQSSQSAVPFSRLEHLNLANNIIIEEEGLLSLSSWPSLRELEIWGNPLTTAFRGDPPIIAIQLGVMRGIHIVRKKPGSTAKPFLAPLKQTVKDELPAALRRKAKLLALEAPPKSPEIAYVGSHPRPLPPISTAPADAHRDWEPHLPRQTATAPPRTKGHRNSSQPSGAWTTPPPERADTTKEGGVKTEAEPTGDEAVTDQETQRQPQAQTQDDGFFMTQVDDGGEELQEKKTHKPSHKKHRRRRDHSDNDASKTPRLSRKYKGYEELLDVEEGEADLIIPKDIQGSVRALQYALDHPLVFSEPALDLQQDIRRRAKKKKVASSRTMSSKGSKVEQLGSLLDKMRLQSKIIENNLEDVLKDYNSNPELRKQYPEVKKLLREVQAKYDEVRFTSMKSAQEVQNSVGDITKSVARIEPEKSSDKINKKVTYDDETEEKLLKLKKLKDKIDSRI